MSRMESEEGGQVIHAWQHIVSRGNSLNTGDIRGQLGSHEAETTEGEQSCLAVKERVISWWGPVIFFLP